MHALSHLCTVATLLRCLGFVRPIHALLCRTRCTHFQFCSHFPPVCPKFEFAQSYLIKALAAAKSSVVFANVCPFSPFPLSLPSLPLPFVLGFFVEPRLALLMLMPIPLPARARSVARPSEADACDADGLSRRRAGSARISAVAGAVPESGSAGELQQKKRAVGAFCPLQRGVAGAARRVRRRRPREARVRALALNRNPPFPQIAQMASALSSPDCVLLFDMPHYVHHLDDVYHVTSA